MCALNYHTSMIITGRDERMRETGRYYQANICVWISEKFVSDDKYLQLNGEFT